MAGFTCVKLSLCQEKKSDLPFMWLEALQMLKNSIESFGSRLAQRLVLQRLGR